MSQESLFVGVMAWKAETKSLRKLATIAFDHGYMLTSNGSDVGKDWVRRMKG